MAHFNYVRAPGLWTFNSVIEPEELEQLSGDLYKAINGDDGGIWAPTSAIVIGGQGLNVTGPLSASGQIFFDSDLEVTGNLEVGGDGAFSGEISAPTAIFGSLNVQGPLTTDAAGQFGNAAGDIQTFTGAAVFNGGLSCPGNAIFAAGTQFDGGIQCNGSLNINGGGLITSPMSFSEDGHIRDRTVTGPNTNTTFSVSTADAVMILSGSISGPLTYYIDNVGAGAGSPFWWSTESTSPVEVRRSVDNVLLFTLSTTSTNVRCAITKFIGGEWKAFFKVVNP